MDALQILDQTIGNMEFWQTMGNLVKPVFIGVDVVLILALLFVFDRLRDLRPKIHPDEHQEKKIITLRDVVFEERWAGIRKKADSDRIESMKLGIIEADKLADDVLKHSGYQGEHMADRLANITQDELKSLNRLWRAHRLRNDIVHTPGFSLSKEQVAATLADYEEFFREVGMLG